jgi:hypothetical protein
MVSAQDQTRHDGGPARSSDAPSQESADPLARAEPGLDGVVVPGALLLLAADLLIRDPSRELAWRLLHGLGTGPAPAWLSPALPAGALFDRDPLGLLLAGLAVAISIAYLGAAIAGASLRVRGWIVAAAIAVVVLFPTFLYASVGFVTGRPFGQDGGVVQMPLALDRLLSGQSPYGADYSDSILGQESRTSAFWRAYGENPIVRHHAYLPGTHLLTLPFYLAARALGVGFDSRIVSTLALLLAILAATRLFSDPSRRLVAAAVVGLNPLVYWHQAFGANDMVFVALLLASALAGEGGRMVSAGALLGLACGTKQLAWPFAPFLLAHWASAPTVRELVTPETWLRLRRPVLAGVAVFASVVAPVALLDPRAFWGDIVSYNAGLGPDAYPLGGTPGLGVGNLLIYFGRVTSLRQPFPFHAFYLLLIPLGLLLVGAQIRRGGLGAALAGGSIALLAVVLFSRVAHANYLIGFAILFPLGLMLEGAPADAAITPLALLGSSTTLIAGGFFRSAWEVAHAANLFSRGPALLTTLSPRSPAGLTADPLGLALGALAAGLALACAASAMLGAGARARSVLVLLAIVIVVVMPTVMMVWISGRTGIVLAADDWVISTRIGAARLARGRSPYAAGDDPYAPGREAWSPSFSRKPPQPLEAKGGLGSPPGASLLALSMSAAGFSDPREVSLLSLVILLWAGGECLAPSFRPLAVPAIALLPPAAFGIIFGAGELPWLAAGALSLVAARRESMLISGLFAGAASAIDFRAIVVVIFAALLGPAPERNSQIRWFALGALLSGFVMIGPLAFMNPAAMAAAARTTGDLAGGAGLVNIASYAGLESSLPLHVLLALGPWIAGGVALIFIRRIPRVPAAMIAGLWLTLTLFFARETTGFALAPPLVLLALGATARSETRLAA